MSGSGDAFPVATGPAVWTAQDFAADRSWLYELSNVQIDALDAAVRRIAPGRSFATLTAQDFPLPSWRDLIADARARLRSGCGFALLRGIPVERYAPEEARLLYWGVGLHFGRAVTQNAAGDLICDITDKGPPAGALQRTYATTKEARFHVDGADLVGLLCLRRARAGGASLLSSAGAVYNAVRSARPDLLPILLRGFAWDRRGENDPCEAPVGPAVPVFAFIGGRLHCRFNPGMMLAAPERLGTPLPPQAAAAIDCVMQTARSPALALAMDFQPGDIQLLSNYAVLHSRAAYEDEADPARKRFLLRLWLDDDWFAYVDAAEPRMRRDLIRYGNLGLPAAAWLGRRASSARRSPAPG